MNLYILFLVSLPEAILNIVLFLLFAGEKRRLKLNRPNVIRFAITLVSMMVATNFLRPIAPNVIVNIIIHLFAYIIIIMVVYRINFKYALLSISFTLLIYTTIENAYVPYIITYISKGMENFSKEFLWYPLYSLPNRICQFVVIWFLWKYEILAITKINKRFHNVFITASLILAVIEYFFLFIFYTYFDKMPLTHQVAFSIALCIMAVVFNLLVFKLVYNAVYGIVRKGYEQYTELEDNVKHAFNEIQIMLKEKNVDGAINLIDELNGNESNINT